MATHKDLDVWKLALDFADYVYDLTIAFPKDELYGLCSQLRRGVVSVPSNIAEGSGRNNTKEYIQFLGIARGSLAEVETQLILSARRKYITQEQLSKTSDYINSIGKMLFRLQEALRDKAKLTV